MSKDTILQFKLGTYIEPKKTKQMEKPGNSKTQ